MADREQYAPGPASGAQVRKDGEKWTLILVRELRHSPEKVWQALSDPAHLRERAPFDADRSLGTVGTVKRTTVGTPAPQVRVTRAAYVNFLGEADEAQVRAAYRGPHGIASARSRPRTIRPICSA